MSVSIRTTYKNSKLRAQTDDTGPVKYCYVPYDHTLGVRENHSAALTKLTERLKWQGDYAIGGTKQGYVFVRVGGKYELGATRVINL